MERELTDNVLFRYYEQILHFKGAKSFVNDINILSYVIDNFTPNKAVQVLKKIVFKYKAQVNELGKHLTGIVTLKDTRIYKQKTPDDLMFELYYMLRCIVIFATVHVGLEKNIYEVTKKIKNDNLNLNSINIYE